MQYVKKNTSLTFNEIVKNGCAINYSRRKAQETRLNLCEAIHNGIPCLLKNLWGNILVSNKAHGNVINIASNYMQLFPMPLACILIAEEWKKIIQIWMSLLLISILMWLRCKFPIIHNIKLIALVLANPSTTKNPQI